MNERILRLFVTLAEELHFGRAAAALHVCQPALSSSLKSLERDLGVQLFERTSRRVDLTPAGEVFLEQARHLLREAERAVALARQSAPGRQTPINIGYPPSIDLRWLGSLISRTRADPRFASRIHFVSSEALYLRDNLMNGALAAAFFAGRSADPDLEHTKLFSGPLLLAYNLGYPVSDSRSIGLAGLGDRPVVWLSRAADPSAHQSFMALCALQGYRPNVVQEVRTFQECVELVRAGIGVSFLPAFLHLDRASIGCRALPEGVLQIEYTSAWPRHRMTEELAAFLSFAQQSGELIHHAS